MRGMTWLVAGLAWGALACGGAGGGAGLSLGPKPGAYAARLAEHVAKEEGLPCPVYADAAEVPFDDWTLDFGQPLLADGESRLPWITNVTEREAFNKAGVRAVIVPYRRRNDAPVKREVAFSKTLKLADGSEAMCRPYNTKLHSERTGTEYQWEAPPSPPDKWIDTSCVYAIQPESIADGAAMYLTKHEVRRDERGRKYDALVAHAVVDLGLAAEGESLRQP